MGGYRNDFHRERMVEHLQAREWTQEDIEHFAHMVGHSALLSSESAMTVLEFQQATDERIAAEKQFDETFAPDFPMPIIERPDAGQLNPPHQVQ